MIVSDPEAPGGERAKILDFGIATRSPKPPVEKPARCSTSGM